MRLAPRSVTWLARHDFRLLVRAWRIDKWATDRSGFVALALIGMLVAHVLMWAVVFMLPAHAPLSAPGLALVALWTTFVLSFMLMSALSRSVEALFERNDFDLLFGAPLAPRVVLTVRTLGIAAATLLVHGLYLLPLANMAMLTGRTWLWSLYLVLPLAALATAAIGIFLSLVLVRAIGARRSRMWVQVIALVAAASGFLTWQLAGPLVEKLLVTGTAPSSDSGSVATAAFAGLATGEPLTLIGLALIAAAACAVCWMRLDRVFLSGTRQVLATRVRQSAPDHAWPSAFSAYWQFVRLRKEWRAVLRDPLLLTRIGTSLIYILPLLFIALRGGDDGGSLQRASAAGIASFIAGSLGQQLALLTVNMEEAPSLLLSSPHRWPALIRAKLWAAAIPAAGVALVLLAATCLAFGVRLLIAAPVLLLSAWATATLVAVEARHVSRELFGKKAAVDIGRGLVVAIVMLIVALASGLTVTPYAWAGFLIAAAIGAFVWSEHRTIDRMRADTFLTR